MLTSPLHRHYIASLAIHNIIRMYSIYYASTVEVNVVSRIFITPTSTLSSVSPTLLPSVSPTSESDEKSDDGLSAGAVAGIIVGGLVGVIVITAILIIISYWLAIIHNITILCS